MNVLFVCKCDPLHVGHIFQIRKLLNMGFDVCVDVLVGYDRVMYIEDLKKFLFYFFDDFGSRFKVVTHNVSYVNGFPVDVVNGFDLLASGNNLILDVWVGDYIFLKEVVGYRSSLMRDMYEDLFKSKLKL